MAVRKAKNEIPTIDCELVTIKVGSDEFGFDTANQISVEVQLEETEAVRLVVKGILRAQKKGSSVITGNTITLTDNVFNPELVLILQGGTIVYDETDPNKIMSYTPPVAGSKDKGEEFELCAYSTQYDTAGNVVRYEKITYPNCTGTPINLTSQDDAFRAPEYNITSMPADGEAPYSIDYVDALPELVENTNP